MKTRWMGALALLLMGCGQSGTESGGVVVGGPASPGAVSGAGAGTGGAEEPAPSAPAADQPVGTGGSDAAAGPVVEAPRDEGKPRTGPRTEPPIEEPPVDEPAPPEDPGPAPAGLIAHEWGTWTSVQSSTGETLWGLHHEEEALPGFVYARFAGEGQKGLEAVPEPVNQKLETPVIYFHTTERTPVRVEVGFPQGIVGQWFPQATTYEPEAGTLTAIADGSMTWDVVVDPDIDPATFPPVEDDSVWAPSRRTTATPVEVGSERERFIFYRGLGRFVLPVVTRAPGEGLVRVENESSELVPAVFVLEVTDEGGAIHPLGALPGGESTTYQTGWTLLPHEAYQAEARAALVLAVANAGLYQDEAEAMVDTWSRSWFLTPGIRVLYVAPRPWTDELLPLTITPEPDAVERVLVGRIEVLTPEEEARVIDLAWEHLGDGPALVAALDRFAEPKLRRARQMIADQKVYEWLGWVITDLAASP